MDIHHRATIDIKGKSISVIGLGLSGSAAAKLAHYAGARVFVSDMGTSLDINIRADEMMQMNISAETGMHSDRINEADLWIVSPCLLYTSPSPRDLSTSRMPSSA